MIYFFSVCICYYLYLPAACRLFVDIMRCKYINDMYASYTKNVSLRIF